MTKGHGGPPGGAGRLGKEGSDVAGAGRRPAGQPTALPVTGIVVVLERGARSGRECRVESPGRVLRMWSLLSEADEELRRVGARAERLDRVRQVFAAVRVELEQSVSADLAGELHRLVQSGQGEPGVSEMRIECASLLGWVSGLVLEMLDQLEAVKDGLGAERHPAGRR